MGIATKLNYLPEDLLSMPDRGRYELVDGQLLERNVSYDTSVIGLVLNARLAMYVLAHKLGWVAQSDAGLQIFDRSPRKVRFADGSFLSITRMPNRPPRGHLRIAPDLTIEIVSPHDEAAEVEQKVAEYFDAGVRLVWVVYPATRSVMVYRPGGKETRLSDSDLLTGEDVVPGFEMPVAEIFDF
jgi:Uma2 family endonuclease